MRLEDALVPTPSVPLPVDLLGVVAAQVGVATMLGVGQILVVGRLGFGLPALGVFVGGWLWFRRRVRGGGVVGRARLVALAPRAAAAHAALWAGGYLGAMTALSQDASGVKLVLGAIAVGVLGAVTSLGLTLCAGDTARATQDDLGVLLRPGRQPGQLLSPADEGLGPPAP